MCEGARPSPRACVCVHKQQKSNGHFIVLQTTTTHERINLLLPPPSPLPPPSRPPASPSRPPLQIRHPIKRPVLPKQFIKLIRLPTICHRRPGRRVLSHLSVPSCRISPIMYTRTHTYTTINHIALLSRLGPFIIPSVVRYYNAIIRRIVFYNNARVILRLFNLIFFFLQIIILQMYYYDNRLVIL